MQHPDALSLAILCRFHRVLSIPELLANDTVTDSQLNRLEAQGLIKTTVTSHISYVTKTFPPIPENALKGHLIILSIALAGYILTTGMWG